MACRRILAKQQKRRLIHAWPINQVAGKIPDGFSGWPEGKQFAFVLTHDIETKKGLNRCRTLAEMEMRLGFRSCFNFVPEGEYATSACLRQWLVSNGFEVGVHDLRHDGQLYRSRESFRASAQRINRYLAEWQAVGFRSAFMLRNLCWLQDLNILYDASTFDTDPFEPQSGGVNTIFPFRVSPDERKSYVELPYTLPQDSTLFVVLKEKSIDTWKRKLDWIAQQGGMALVNVHPDYMNFNGKNNGSEYPAQRYEEFLEYVTKNYRHQCWLALPSDVANYFPSAFPPGINSPARTQPTVPLKHIVSSRQLLTTSNTGHLRGNRVAMVSFSPYPDDPRPCRAANALVQEGMSVELICLIGDKKLPTREIVNGIDVLRIPITHRRGGKFAYAYEYSAFILISSLILALRSLTRSYDLVYVHNMPDILVLSSLVPKALGAKVVLDLHDPMPELMRAIFRLPEHSSRVQLLKRLEKWSIARADLVITVNRACKRIFSSRSCRPEKIGVVMNSPDEEIFQFHTPHTHGSGTRAANKPFVIMYHGSLVERNGLDLAVEALARVRKTVPTAELRIYGARSSFLTRVMNSTRNNGVQGAIRYMGPRRLEDIVQAIEECDVGVIPNQRNIFTEINTPTRIFEYLALGKPVIAPRAQGIQDYFDNKSLLYFELGNSDDLARNIQYVHSQPNETLEIVRRGQQVYREHAWRGERQAFLNLVSGLLRSGDETA